MEEEEEIDILGDFDLSKNEREISNISAGQILSCDYTVHPRWLTDNPLNGDFASENVSQEVCIEYDEGLVYSSEEEYENQLETVVIENDWSNEMISSEDQIILEESIPATVEEEVVALSYEDAHEAEDNLKELQAKQSTLDPSARSLLAIRYNIPKPHPRSLLKSSYQQPKFIKTLSVDKTLLKSNQTFLKKLNRYLRKNVVEKKVKDTVSQPVALLNASPLKFRQIVNIKLDKAYTPKRSVKKPKKPSTTYRTRKISSPRARSGIVYDENITINHNESAPILPMEITTVSACTSQENNDESDVEVDIEYGEADNILPVISTQIEIPKYDIQNRIIITTPPLQPSPTHSTSPPVQDTRASDEFIFNLLANCSDEIKDFIVDSTDPKEEFILNSNEATELEKLVHYEFFEGRPTKTPDRYMKIRCHILNTWYALKPGYVSKTAVRSGLKHCGDVNCISRIHSLLEQIGAINFGCSGEYFNYIRPLTSLIASFAQPARQNKLLTSSSHSATSGHAPPDLDRKQRHKPISYKQFDSNYTISHNGDGGDEVDESVKTVAKKSTKQFPKYWNYEFELIKCQQFISKPCPLNVSITLSTLLCFYLHGLSSSHEVMGFLGGYRSKSIGRNKLSIARYKPCETSQQSGTMCEMCPVSQVEQSTSLLAEGYDLLGWFHTHPLFPPNPSRTDVRTQAEMQIQFSANDEMPFVGLILSCLDMMCKCIYILPANGPLTMTNGVPYEIQIDVIKDCTSFSNDVLDVIRLVKRNGCDLQVIMEKFSTYANDLLCSHGYDVNVLNAFKDILLTQ